MGVDLLRVHLRYLLLDLADDLRAGRHRSKTSQTGSGLDASENIAMAGRSAAPPGGSPAPWRPRRAEAPDRGPEGSTVGLMDRRHIALLFTVGVLALALGIVGIRGLAQTRSTSAEPAVHAPASKFEGALLPPGVRTPRF